MTNDEPSTALAKMTTLSLTALVVCQCVVIVGGFLAHIGYRVPMVVVPSHIALVGVLILFVTSFIMVFWSGIFAANRSFNKRVAWLSIMAVILALPTIVLSNAFFH